MKRIKFIKGLLLAPAVLTLGKFLPKESSTIKYFKPVIDDDGPCIEIKNGVVTALKDCTVHFTVRSDDVIRPHTNKGHHD